MKGIMEANLKMHHSAYFVQHNLSAIGDHLVYSSYIL